MRALLPVVTPEDICRLKTLSPDAEFYAGIELPAWSDTFGRNADLNRMSAFGKTANMSGVASVLALCDAADGNELFLTLNAPSYSLKQLSFLDSFLDELCGIRLSGIIIGDPALVGIVRKHHLKAVASTMIGVYNADIAKWCVGQGFQRLILPRDLTLEEIQSIVSAVPSAEYECFLMRNGCRYSDSHCLAKHKNQYGALCTCLDRSRTEIHGESERSFAMHDAALFNHHLFARAFHKSTCGLCAIWRMTQMGIAAGKVVGRADGINSIEQDVRIIAENLNIAREADSESAYLSHMIYPQNYDEICYGGLNCYFSEIRYPE